LAGPTSRSGFGGAEDADVSDAVFAHSVPVEKGFHPHRGLSGAQYRQTVFGPSSGPSCVNRKFRY